MNERKLSIHHLFFLFKFQYFTLQEKQVTFVVQITNSLPF